MTRTEKAGLLFFIVGIALPAVDGIPILIFRIISVALGWYLFMDGSEDTE